MKESLKEGREGGKEKGREGGRGGGRREEDGIGYRRGECQKNN